MADILIKNGRVFDGQHFLPEHTSILIEGGKITSIGENLTADAAYVLDAGGKTVLPGLVDAHLHLRGISSDQYGFLPLMGTLPYGVTAAADAGAGMGDAALLDALPFSSVVFVSVPIRDNHAALDRLPTLMEKYGSHSIGLKVYLDTTISPVTDETALAETVAFAARQGWQVMVHSSHPPVPMMTIVNILRPGDILTHAYHGGEHPVSEDRFACLLAAKEKGLWVDAGMAGHVHTDFALLRAAIEGGAEPDILSSDLTRLSLGKRGGNYGLPLCMAIAAHLGMAETAIFRAVTSTPAKALGKADAWGTLAVGRRADIAILDQNGSGFDLTSGIRIQADASWQCCWTICHGEIVYRKS